MDSNHDGVIDGKDAQFGDLRVWIDANADGVSQAGELKTLSELHIASLTVGATKVSELDNNNWIGLRSGYTSDDGTAGQMADVWFLASRAAQVSALTQAINHYGQQAQGGDAGNSGGQLAPPADTAASQAAAASLAGNVAALTEQLQRYGAPGAGLAGSGGAHGEGLAAQAKRGNHRHPAAK